MSKQVIKAALEAMFCMRDMVAHPDNLAFIDKHISVLQAALAEPEQEPYYGFGIDWGTGGGRPCCTIVKKLPNGVVEVVACEYGPAPTPRQWVSLTEQEMYDLFFHDQYGPRLPEYLVNTIKCVEAALKEKNNG